MEVSKNKVVTMHYTLKDDEGRELDSSQDGDPLVFLHGHGALIEGLEDALVGKKKDDKFKVRIDCAKGYGEHDESLTLRVPRDNFDDAQQVVAGAQFQAETDEGPTVVTVVGVEGEFVIVDGNHPLAGIDLNFDVHVVDIREATSEEMSHGHVHGAGGHDH